MVQDESPVRDFWLFKEGKANTETMAIFHYREVIKQDPLKI